MKWESKTNVLGTGRCGNHNDCVDPLIVRGAILAIIVLMLIVLFNPVETDQEFGSFGFRPDRLSTLKTEDHSSSVCLEFNLCELSLELEATERIQS